MKQSEIRKVFITSKKGNKNPLKEFDAPNSDVNLFSNQFPTFIENLAGFGICKVDIVSGKINFSENLYRIIGYEPDSFAPTLKNIFNLIHPEDIKKFKDFSDLITRENCNITKIDRLRIISATKASLYLSIKGQLISETGKDTLVLAIKDITEERNCILSLEKEKAELLKSNSELSAFNQIASHDLQEPLRKIQIFISRLKQMEEINLSRKAGDYINKVQMTAKRMQMLIIDLLMFSRISKSKDHSEFTYIQNILQDSLHEIAFQVEEKKALIHMDPLPFAKVIPFQIQQLFTNLLSNSLKYAKNNTAPVIKIKNEKLSPNEIEKFPNIPEEELIKISVTDNGIGFNPSEAENIFVIFKRLHAKLEYSGTGIGLAICKSIVENHGGLIEATSIPGEGTKISFIIPSNPSYIPGNTVN